MRRGVLIFVESFARIEHGEDGMPIAKIGQRV
jgi:hypothetical protein